MRLGLLLAIVLTGCATAPPGPTIEASSTIAPRARPPLPPPLVLPEVALSSAVRLALPGGMKVLVVERPRSPLVSVRVVFDRGSASEPVSNAGLSYLAFALLGEGRELDAAQKPIIGEKSLRRQFTEIGGQYRWSVTPDASMLGVDGYVVDLERYLDLLADGVIRPRAGAQALASYRTAIREGLEDLETSDTETVARVLAQAAFGAGHPYARPVMGTVQSLADLSFDEVADHQKRLLGPAQATLVVVGDVSAQRVATLALRAFRDWRSTAPRGSVVPVPPPEAAHRPPVRVIDRSPAATTLICGARPLGDVPLTDASADVLTYVLGDGVSSRLSVLREVHGWSYSPNAVLIRRKYGRSLLMCANVDASVTVQALGVFVDTLAQARTASISAAAIEEAKAVLTARARARGDEVSGAMSDTLARLIAGSTPEDQVARLDAVTAEQVRALATRVLDPNRLNLILLGPAAIAQQAARQHALGSVTRVRMADIGGGAQLAPAPRQAPRVAAIDPLDGRGNVFDIREATSDRGTLRVVLRISDRPLDEALRDVYALVDHGGAVVGAPQLVQTISRKGVAPLYLIRLLIQAYTVGSVRVSRASGGETPTFTIKP